MRLLTYVICCCKRLDVTGTRMYMLVLAIRQCILGLAAQHVATPTMSTINFREENFRDQKSNHKIQYCATKIWSYMVDENTYQLLHMAQSMHNYYW